MLAPDLRQEVGMLQHNLTGLGHGIASGEDVVDMLFSLGQNVIRKYSEGHHPKSYQGHKHTGEIVPFLPCRFLFPFSFQSSETAFYNLEDALH